MKNTLPILFLILFSSDLVFSQADSLWNYNYERIETELRSLEDSLPGLNETVNTSVSGVTVEEFLRGVAKSTGVNLSVDPGISFKVINNFNDVRVIDVLLYLSRQFRLDLSVIGNIIVVSQAKAKQVMPVCQISYDSLTDQLSLDVVGEDIYSLSRKITESSGKNIIPAAGLNGLKINTFIKEMPFTSAMDKLAYANNLVFRVTDDGYFIIEKKGSERTEQTQKKDTPAAAIRQDNLREGTYKLDSKLLGHDSLSLYAEKAPVAEIIKEISSKTGNNYLMTSVPKGEMNLQISGAHYIDILDVVLSGSDHVFKRQNDIYMIGNKNQPELMFQRILQMQYRAVDSVMSYLPKDITSDIEIKVFREQNSLMLSGPTDKVNAAELFIRQIDKLVPVISIEVLIIDYNTSYHVQTGINAGIGSEPSEPSSGGVFPAVDINLNSQSVNDLISRFNGFGWAKIGNVTPNFYASIKALESQGILNIRSTPMLATLNGHETELTIGNTEYYLEEMTNIIGTQNPQTATIKTYKPVAAELAVVITPVVSGDDQITLTVEVTQSDFTERLSTTAPPGLVSRNFKSQIRVKNGEMILLGGLEENRNSDTSNGMPILSRIPVLKWLFSNRNDEKSKSKLNIFIKPTIIS